MIIKTIYPAFSGLKNRGALNTGNSVLRILESLLMCMKIFFSGTGLICYLQVQVAIFQSVSLIRIGDFGP